MFTVTTKLWNLQHIHLLPALTLSLWVKAELRKAGRFHCL